LSVIDWSALNNSTSTVEEYWNSFKAILAQLEEKFIPTKTYHSDRLKKPVWMTHKSWKSVKRKYKVFSKYKNKDHPAVIAANRTAKKDLRKARMNFEKKLAHNIKQDSKSFYSYAKSKSKVKVRICSLKQDSGTVLDDDFEIATCFNTFFASVFTQEDLHNVPQPVNMGISEEDQCTDIWFTECDVLKILDSLRMDKSPGPDELLPRLLSEVKEEIAHPLYVLFRRSLDESSVPTEWKRANVCPIFKKGSRNLAENYRTVSLTCQVCKIFETLVRDRLVKHLEENSLIRESQHGFRKGRSCLTNLLTFLDKVTGCIDSGNSVDVVFLDFAKAFDKVPHSRLAAKLRSHGIDGKLLCWIMEWLKDRKQRVVIRGTLSDWISVLSGIPQGSVLGPILFLVYINDLDYGVRNWILKFADDTQIFSQVSSPEDYINLQKDLNRLVTWAEEWQMLFNVGKCKVMHFGRLNQKRDYYMKDHKLETTSTEKDLGIVITSDLKSSEQCSQAYSKASRVLGMIQEI